MENKKHLFSSEPGYIATKCSDLFACYFGWIGLYFLKASNCGCCLTRKKLKNKKQKNKKKEKNPERQKAVRQPKYSNIRWVGDKQKWSFL